MPAGASVDVVESIILLRIDYPAVDALSIAVLGELENVGASLTADARQCFWRYRPGPQSGHR